MDRLKPNRPREPSLVLQLVVLAGLVLAVFGILVYKEVDEGWFALRTPLDLSTAPVLVFFNRHKGCECEMVVYEAAQEQIWNWPAEARRGMRIIHVDLDRRPDLGMQFDIFRVPALFLVDQNSRVMMSQTKSLSDAAPLDLAAVEKTIEEIEYGTIDHWFTDLDAALTAGRQQGKGVLLQFHRDECAGCKKLYAQTYPDADFNREEKPDFHRK